MKKKYGTLQQYNKICAEIYEERDKTCERCGKYLREPRRHNFNHTAGRRENFLNKKTIELLCFVCHAKYHRRKELNGDWLDL